MHKAIKIILWSLATLLVLVVGLLLYLRNADLSVYEKQIEDAVSNAIGHKVDFTGTFELHFGSQTYVVAEDVHITNDNWPGDNELITVGHFSVTFDTWSVFSSPFIVEHLEVRDVHINGIRNEDGLANWDTGRVRQEQASNEPIDVSVIAFKVVSLQNFTLVLDEPSRDKPLNVGVQHLSIIPDESDVLALDLHGTVNEYSLSANGKLGPWQNLLDGRDLQADLDLAVGEVRLGIDGTVDDLATLEGLNLSMSLDGPAIERVALSLCGPAFAL